MLSVTALCKASVNISCLIEVKSVATPVKAAPLIAGKAPTKSAASRLVKLAPLIAGKAPVNLLAEIPNCTPAAIASIVNVPSAAESSVVTRADKVTSPSIAVSNSDATKILLPPIADVFVIPLIVILKDETV